MTEDIKTSFRERCFQFAYQLYLNSEERGEDMSNQWQLGKVLEIDKTAVQAIADQLKSEGLLDYVSFAGDVTLTTFGTAAVMQALAEKDQATVYFPPVCDLIYTQASGESLITLDSINDFIDNLSRDVDEMPKDSQQRLTLEGGISLLEQYVAGRAVDPGPLRRGLEQVCQLLTTS